MAIEMTWIFPFNMVIFLSYANLYQRVSRCHVLSWSKSAKGIQIYPDKSRYIQVSCHGLNQQSVQISPNIPSVPCLSRSSRICLMVSVLNWTHGLEIESSHFNGWLDKHQAKAPKTMENRWKSWENGGSLGFYGAFVGFSWDLPFGKPSQKKAIWKDPPCFMAKLTSFLWQFWIKPNHIPAVPGWSLGPGALRGYIPRWNLNIDPCFCTECPKPGSQN